MAKMQLVITLRKEVEDQAQGEQEYNWVKNKLAEHPEIEVTGHITNHFDGEDNG